jgi:hypothetical protein
MEAYRDMYNNLEGRFDGCEVSHISRESSEEADALANIGFQCLPVPPRVFREEIKERSIKETKPAEVEKPKKGKTTKCKAVSGQTRHPKKRKKQKRRKLKKS